jgi:DNA polymerase-3 subunit gamma/tau
MDDAARVAAFAAAMTPEAVQLAYQICVQGRADLALAPDEATGFTMTLLRLLAFEPGNSAQPAAGQGAAAREGAPARRAIAGATGDRVTAAPPHPQESNRVAPSAGLVAAVTLPDDAANWPAFVARLTLPPIAAQLAAQTELKSIKGNVLTLALPAAHKHLADKAYSDKLKAALDQATGRRWLLAFEVGAAAETSLAAQEKRARAEQQSQTEAAFRDEPFVRDVLERFDAKIRSESIKPVS